MDTVNEIIMHGLFDLGKAFDYIGSNFITIYCLKSLDPFYIISNKKMGQDFLGIQ